MKILVVDDSRTGRNYIQKTLLIGGVKAEDVIQAENGQKALEILKKEPIGVLFLDINMPVLGGVEVVNEISQKGLMSCSQIVITSSLSDTARVDALKNLGVKHFAKKPFSPEAIFSIYQMVGN